ncbi:MAG TPA: ATP-binding protein [Bacteriovoracaceae bacterium]|nr:ATP-binding protein [Bacteriovoracaceae bacterium]
MNSKVPILVVDDRPENRLAIEAVLKSNDYLLVEASSGQQALSHLENYEFAVILLDVQMPGMDGFETAFHVRHNQNTKSTPIMFITANFEDNDRMYKGYEAGAVDFLYKPFDPTVLRSKVSIFVDLYRARKEIIRQSELLRLEDSRARDSFLENALDAVIGMNAEGNIIYWNKQAEKIFGWTKSEILGKRMCEVLIPIELRQLRDNGLETFRLAGIGSILNRHVEITALRKNSETFMAELSITPIRSGDVDTYSAFLRDITDKKKAELSQKQEHQKLLESEENLKRALSVRDEFIGICSHELKTPLTALKLHFQMDKRLMDKNDPKVYSKEAVEKRINSSTLQLDRMTKLIKDMLDVSALSNGKLNLETEKLDFATLVTNVISSFEDLFTSEGIEVNFLKQDPSLMITGDTFRLEQVITNLITNAVKYGNGSLIEIVLWKEDSRAHFKIKDRGIGIEEGSLERIFSRYERAISSTNISGLGLGLYISKQIIDAHQGKIRVESQKGVGSSFILSLPLEQVSGV